MKSWWFVYFEILYKNIENQLVEIRGNFVLGLNSETFLPGTAEKALTNSLMPKIKHKLLKGGDVVVLIKSFGKIDEEGFKDFSGKEVADNLNFWTKAREFIHQKIEFKITAS